jgi:hypothetical protein
VLDIPLLLVVAPPVKMVAALSLTLPALFAAEAGVNPHPEGRFIAAELAEHLQVMAEATAGAAAVWLLGGLHFLGQPAGVAQAGTLAMGAGVVRTTLLLVPVMVAVAGVGASLLQMEPLVLAEALAALVCWGKAAMGVGVRHHPALLRLEGRGLVEILVAAAAAVLLVVALGAMPI